MFAATHSAEDLHAALPTPFAGELIIWQNALVLRELKEMRGLVVSHVEELLVTGALAEGEVGVPEVLPGLSAPLTPAAPEPPAPLAMTSPANPGLSVPVRKVMKAML